MLAWHLMDLKRSPAPLSLSNNISSCHCSCCYKKPWNTFAVVWQVDGLPVEPIVVNCQYEGPLVGDRGGRHQDSLGVVMQGTPPPKPAHTGSWVPAWDILKTPFLKIKSMLGNTFILNLFLDKLIQSINRGHWVNTHKNAIQSSCHKGSADLQPFPEYYWVALMTDTPCCPILIVEWSLASMDLETLDGYTHPLRFDLPCNLAK